MPVRMDDLLKQYVNWLKAYPFYANVDSFEFLPLRSIIHSSTLLFLIQFSQYNHFHAKMKYCYLPQFY